MALIRISVLKDFRATALSTTDVSTGYSLGTSNDATKRLYAGLHLTSASLGTTARMLVMTLQNASSSGFGAITTANTFALSTAQGAEWMPPTAVGSLSTDKPWWRASWALSTAASTGGTWKGLVYMGAQ